MAVTRTDQLSMLTDDEKKLLNQSIRIGRQNEPSSILPVPRIRLKKETIDDLFGTDAEFLRNDAGEIIHHDNWIIECNTIALYYIVNYKKRPPKIDPGVDPYYQGTSLLVCQNVPELVSADDVKVWLRRGILQEDRDVQYHEKGVANCDKEVMAAERRLQAIPYMETKAKEFKKQAEERRLMSELVNEERQKFLKEKQHHLAALDVLAKRDSVRVEVLRLEHNPRMKTSLWQVELPGYGGEEIVQKLAIKENWNLIMLGRGDPDAEPPIEACTAIKELPPEVPARLYSNRRNVEVVRLKHGKGSYLFPNGDVWKGGWKLARQHGHGIFFEKSGTFTGTMDNGHRKGSGRMVFADGSSYRGQWGLPMQSAPSLINGTEYSIGVANGKGKFSYANGAELDGQWLRGLPHGHCKFTHPRGDTIEGNFHKGVIHGDGLVNISRRCGVPRKEKKMGLKISGRFRDGVPNGKLEIERSAKFGGYHSKGRARDGLLHGIAETRWNNGDRYHGEMCDGYRHGYGDLMFGDVKQKMICGVQSWAFGKKYGGRWTVDTTESRGQVIIPIFGEDGRTLGINGRYTTSNKSLHFPRIWKLGPAEARDTRRLMKKIERDRKETLEKTKEIRGINYRNYRRARYRANLVLEQVGEVMAAERQALIDEEKWRLGKRRILAKALQLKKKNFRLPPADVARLQAQDDAVFDDGFFLQNELDKLQSDFDMAVIMAKPPDQEELDVELDKIANMADDFEDRRYYRKKDIEERLRENKG